MSFADGTAEARVAARYAEYGTPQELGQAIADAERKQRMNVAGPVPTQQRRINVASERAVDYLVSLSLSRYPNVAESAVRDWARTADRKLVSEKIDFLKAMPKAVPTAPVQNLAAKYDVPAGRYAVTGDEGQTVFVRVDRPIEGRWAGRTFVKVQAGDDLHRVSATTAAGLLRKITEAGVQAASKRYGAEIGDCGVCGRTLTNEESRAAGIGPRCAAKMGW